VDVKFSETRNGRKNGAAKRVLFVGRISPEKGLHVLLEAFQQIARTYPDVELEIVGPKAAPPVAFIFKLSNDPTVAGLMAHCNGDYLTALEERVPAELRQRVSFSGAIPHSVLAARYAAADIYVQPSLIEAFPLPIPEAMAAGVPVVGTRVGGIPEAITDGVTGRLVDSNDAEALAEAIVDLLRDEPSRRSMGQSARARALERFSWEHVAENLLGVYESMS
jgi:glycosyltransferase involved in cell wall biosynthesis